VCVSCRIQKLSAELEDLQNAITKVDGAATAPFTGAFSTNSSLVIRNLFELLKVRAAPREIMALADPPRPDCSAFGLPPRGSLMQGLRDETADREARLNTVLADNVSLRERLQTLYEERAREPQRAGDVAVAVAAPALKRQRGDSPQASAVRDPGFTFALCVVALEVDPPSVGCRA
jgi:hypothetical protein